jgi:lipoprotein-anchoring transpeptidase ErfK/SrfK
MANRRVYELAREHGLSSSELLERLERAGVHDKKPLSTVDEAIVEQALADVTTDGRSAREDPDPAPVEVPPGPQLGPIELRRRLWRLRRLHDSQLKELGGLAVELRRLGSPRYEDLADERLKAAAATERELLALERQRSPENVGGVCPSCGLHSRQTRYCLRCGEELPGRRRFDPISPAGAGLAVVLVAAAWLLGGVSFGGGDSARAPATSAAGDNAARDLGPRSRAAAKRPRFASLVATARTSQVAVYSSPHASTPVRTLANPNLDGAPVTFLVRKRVGHWARVLLPERPNGSTGWIRLKHMSLTGHSYRVVIDLDQHVLFALNGPKLVLRTPIGVGRAVTPTPVGLYYITELLKQPDPTGSYGPYAFGLSAHSDVLNEFAGRDGILGLHGTDFPQGIGTDVSHGCIRMSNHAITKLAHVLPVGTPVRITRNRGSSA